MDWTGYPKDLAPDDLVDTAEDLARFLADPAEQPFVEALLALADLAAAGLPERADRIAVGFPREVQARATWLGYTPTPTAAELVTALAQIPDVPDDTPAELLPVTLQRLLVTALPNTDGNVTMMYRVNPGEALRTSQYVVPTPSVDIDPVLLTAPDGARLAVRLTVEEQP